MKFGILVLMLSTTWKPGAVSARLQMNERMYFEPYALTLANNKSGAGFLRCKIVLSASQRTYPPIPLDFQIPKQSECCIPSTAHFMDTVRLILWPGTSAMHISCSLAILLLPHLSLQLSFST
jgi:hypothetical protein